MKKTKHYFASANTSENFICYFDNINTETNPFLYIIKGAPGTGKSSLMKKVGEYYFTNGYEVEYFHCSSDSNSLDGVRLKDFNIAIIDGTSPHSFDTDLPSVNSKIINLGEFISRDIKKHEDKIKKLINQKKYCYNILYGYLKSAKSVYEVNKFLFKLENKNFENDFLSHLKLENQQGNFCERKLFRTIIDSSGQTNFDKENEFQNIIKLKNNSFQNQLILQDLRDNLKHKNYSFTTYFNIISPSDIEAIYISKTDTLIAQDEISTNNKVIKSNQKIINNLLTKSAKLLKKAIKYHKNIEKYYIKHVNFEKIDKLTINLIEEINQNIKEKTTI